MENTSTQTVRTILVTGGVVGVIIIGVAGYFWISQNAQTPPPSDLVACTLEAKICPDGSAVGRSGPNCEFSECPPTKESQNEDPIPTVQSHSVPDANLRFLAPTEMTVTSETQRVGTAEPYSLTLYVQRSSTNPAPFYQLYGLYQFDRAYSQDDVEIFKEDLEPSSLKEIAISGYPALEGQVKGQRNRFVTYIFTEKGRFSLFTAEPTPENKAITDQILATFEFTR